MLRQLRDFLPTAQSWGVFEDIFVYEWSVIGGSATITKSLFVYAKVISVSQSSRFG